MQQAGKSWGQQQAIALSQPFSPGNEVSRITKRHLLSLKPLSPSNGLQEFLPSFLTSLLSVSTASSLAISFFQCRYSFLFVLLSCFLFIPRSCESGVFEVCGENMSHTPFRSLQLCKLLNLHFWVSSNYDCGILDSQREIPLNETPFSNPWNNPSTDFRQQQKLYRKV